MEQPPNKVDVVICGEIITLKSNEKPEYLQKLARYIDEKMAEIVSTNINAAINERIRTLLIALNVADDFYKTKDAHDKLTIFHEKFVSEVARLRTEKDTLEKKLNALRTESVDNRKKLSDAETELEILRTQLTQMRAEPKPDISISLSEAELAMLNSTSEQNGDSNSPLGNTSELMSDTIRSEGEKENSNIVHLSDRNDRKAAQ